MRAALARGLLVMWGLGVGLGLGEGLLRAHYPRLPSLAPLESAGLTVTPFDWTVRPEDRKLNVACYERQFMVQPIAPRDRNMSTEGLRLWVSGDSVAAGIGDDEGGGFVDTVQRGLSAHFETRVATLNLAAPGSGYCDDLLYPMQQMQGVGVAPDVMVVELFADDLEERAAVVSADRLVMLPGMVKNPLGRALVSYSYVGNLAWYAIRPEAHVGLVRTIDAQGRSEFKQAMSDFLQVMAEQDVAVVVALVSPTGLPFCPPNPPQNSRCRWLGQDVDLMAQMLHELGVHFVDLRDLWGVDPDRRALAERQVRFESAHGMAVHPDHEGHRMIGEAIVNDIKARFPPSWLEEHRRRAALRNQAADSR